MARSSATRAAKKAKTGKKPGGREPKAPDATPRAADQVNLTDEESRIMKVTGGGFEQSYNTQAAVDTETMLVLAAHMTQAGNDKAQVEPMVAQLQALPEGLNSPQQLLADTGFFSGRHVEICKAAQITPLIAVGRDEHHPDWRERFEEPAPLTEPACHVEQMRHALKTKPGRATYALKKQTVEPVVLSMTLEQLKAQREALQAARFNGA